MLARELLSKPDGVLTATIGEEEYVIDGFTRTKTHANLDDSMCYWTIVCKDSKDRRY